MAAPVEKLLLPLLLAEGTTSERRCCFTHFPSHFDSSRTTTNVTRIQVYTCRCCQASQNFVGAIAWFFTRLLASWRIVLAQRSNFLSIILFLLPDKPGRYYQPLLLCSCVSHPKCYVFSTFLEFLRTFLSVFSSERRFCFMNFPSYFESSQTKASCHDINVSSWVRRAPSHASYFNLVCTI